MGIYAVWPFFACLFLLLMLAASPVFRFADNQDSLPNRVSALDGLRGFLALSVFFYHASIYHKFLAAGLWEAPPSYFYQQLGPWGVSIFFMITGYLFWRIMIKNAGRPQWLELYIGRIFRIGPLYLFAMIAAIVTIFSYTGFALKVPLADFFKSLLTIGMLGLFPMPLVINGYGNTFFVLMGVTWSLQYEWYFYGSLLLTGQAARSKITAVALPVISLAVLLFLISSPILQNKFHLNAAWLIYTSQFCSGMICAAVQAFDLRAALPNWLASIFVIALVSCKVLFVNHLSFDEAFGLLSVSFYLIVSGSNIFGLLATTAARRLGNISFGIYLLQGLILNWVFAVTPIRQYALASPYQYWSAVVLCAVSLIFFAMAGHYLLEQPGIKLGRLAGHGVSVCLRRARRILIA